MNAARYVEQLCKHWSHRLQVERDGEAARIAFPSGALAAFEPREAELAIALTASDAATLAQTQEVVAVHLDRFAFREGPLAFDWKAG